MGFVNEVKTGNINGLTFVVIHPFLLNIFLTIFTV